MQEGKKRVKKKKMERSKISRKFDGPKKIIGF